jgi:hypothetical protein
MAAPIASNIDKIFSGVDGTVYTTPSITLPGGTLIMLSVMGNRSLGASALPVIGGTIVTPWTLVITDTFNSVAVPLTRAALFYTYLPSPQTGTINVTWAANQDAGWIVTDKVDNANVMLQAGLSTKADAAVTVSVAGFNNFGLASAVYAATFVGISAVINVGSSETKIIELQGGVALETGTIETEFKTNVTSVSATFALANTLSIAVPVGINDDVMVISRSHGLLMDAIRGEL